MSTTRKQGFSLVELLVVIAIFGLLVSLVLASVTQARARARDSRRERDIKSLQTALTAFASNSGSYPLWSSNPTEFQHLACVSTNEIFSQLSSSGALDAPICDPLNNATYRYEYRAADAAGGSYQVRYNLETDSISGKSAGVQTVTP